MNRYIFAIHRGGSSILGKLGKCIAQKLELDITLLGDGQKHRRVFGEIGERGASSYIVDDNGKRIFRKCGEPVIEPNVQNWKNLKNSLFVPIRNANYFPPEHFNQGDKAVLNIRDPRDCLTSGYFGFLLLHGGGLDSKQNKDYYEMGIDKYILEILLPKYEVKLNDYIELIKKINDDGFSILKYEDMILDFPKWYRDLCEKLELDFEKAETIQDRLAENFNPVKCEDPLKHKRKMVPGDYKHKLTTSTIDEINNRLSSQLEFFGYPL